mgnify:CR=1 FL=1
MTSTGLTTAEAAERLARHGANAPPAVRGPSLARRVAQQFRDPLVRLLVVAVVLDLAVWGAHGAGASPFDALTITVILLLNAGLGVAQELRSERALERLAAVAAPWCSALRDGVLVRVAARELVPGDVVRLGEGDRVPADAAVLPGPGFLVDESLLTGESVPVPRAEREELAAGTLVVRGAGLVEVVRTGASSALGRLAGLLGGVAAGSTPLERRMAAFGRRVTWAVAAISVAVVVLGVALEGTGHLLPTVLFAVALAVAAVPEGLPAVLTFSLAVGVERMAARRAAVRRLAAVESLGSVTVIATDKTGTLTENRLVVRAVDAPDEERLARAAVLANDADPLTGVGDPLDTALLAWARGRGVDAVATRRSLARRSGREFDARARSMRVTVAEGAGGASYVKGAPEEVLARCDIGAAERADWLARAERHAAAGLRVLAFARGAGETETHLTPLGLALLWDAPRPEAADAVRRARGAGIRVLMVTGDHPATAGAVARAVGIDAERVVEGAAFDAVAGDALARRVAECDVFARFTPEQKLRLVELLQAEGAIVAMTGDGVNDAPALKRADVGVAMGLRGSDVAREVSDLVLLDDHVATIVAAVEEGRRILANVRTFVRFLIATNAAELVVLVVGFPLAWGLGLREADGSLLLPLTAAQILWVNLLTDGPPALALAFDARSGALDRPPQDPSSPLLDRGDALLLGVCAASVAALGLGLLELARLRGESADAARTALFVFVSLAQLALVDPIRRLEGRPRANAVLRAALAGAAAVLAAAVIVPALRRLLALELPSPVTSVAALVAVAMPWALARLSVARRLRRRAAADISAQRDLHASRPHRAR